MCPAIFSSYSTLLMFLHDNHCRLLFKATPLSVSNGALTTGVWVFPRGGSI